MATKKEKREAALAKREDFLKKIQQSGLEAQEAAHARRVALQRQAQAQADERRRRAETIDAVRRLANASS